MKECYVMKKDGEQKCSLVFDEERSNLEHSMRSNTTLKWVVYCVGTRLDRIQYWEFL
jgi:hypothetical protein